MQKFKVFATSRLVAFIGGMVLALGIAWPSMGTAQEKSSKMKDPNQHAQHTVDDKLPAGDQDLASQIAELRDSVARLEAALAKGQPDMKPGMSGMAGMSTMGSGNPPFVESGGAMQPASGMGGMSNGASPPAGQMGMMGMKMDKMMGMAKMEMAGMMGMMSGMSGSGGSSMATVSALPGFPGASHLYHIGATSFFLDHPQHIVLSTEQQMMLNQTKVQTALDKASTDRSVEEAEQALWMLTAADQPDNA